MLFSHIHETIFNTYISDIPVLLGYLSTAACNCRSCCQCLICSEGIEKRYEQETGRQIDLVIGSSGKLCAQIKEGGPFDIFLSADMNYPQALSDQGLTIGAPQSYGNGALVLWTMKDINNFSLESLLLEDTKRIAIANPKLAPYGEAAISVLNYYRFYPNTAAKLVYGESLSQL